MIKNNLIRNVYPYLSIILLLLLAPASQSAEKSAKIRVFLLGGQSNMVGPGESAELKPPYDAPLQQIKFWQNKNKQWTPLAPGKKFGPEISFGHAMAHVLPADDVRLVKYAAGGTSLHKDWAPSGGKQYLNFMATAKAALADLDAGKVPYEICGMLWLQGESDAKEKQGKAYEENLEAFITHMRTEFKTPDMPFIIARVRDYYGKGPQAELVRDAQKSLAHKMKHVAWFDTDDCDAPGGHYQSDGIVEIGKRFAAKYTEMAAPSAGVKLK